MSARPGPQAPSWAPSLGATLGIASWRVGRGDWLCYTKNLKALFIQKRLYIKHTLQLVTPPGVPHLYTKKHSPTHPLHLSSPHTPSPPCLSLPFCHDTRESSNTENPPTRSRRAFSSPMASPPTGTRGFTGQQALGQQAPVCYAFTFGAIDPSSIAADPPAFAVLTPTATALATAATSESPTGASGTQAAGTVAAVTTRMMETPMAKIVCTKSSTRKSSARRTVYMTGPGV